MKSGTWARVIGFVAFALFLWCVPVGNWMQEHLGTDCTVPGQCTVAFAPGLNARSGVAMVGVALVLRGLVHRFLGIAPSFIAVLGGALVAAVMTPPELLVVSTVAILAGEMASLVVYSRLGRTGLPTAILASAVVGVAVDSAVFLYMGFWSLEQFPAAALVKVLAVMACMPLVLLLRRVPPAPLT